MANQKTGALRALLNVIFFIPVVAYMALKKSGSWICNKAYRGGWVRGIFIGLVGVGVSVFTASSTADFLSTTVGWKPFAVFTGGTVAFVLTMTHIWPFLYWAIVRHIWNFGEKVLKVAEKFSKNVFKPFTEGLIGVLRNAPGSNALWSIVEGKVGGKSWGIKLLQSALVVGAFALAGLIGFVTCKALIGVGTLPALSFMHLEHILAGVVGFTAAYFSVAIGFNLVKEGDGGATAMAYSGVGTWALLTQTSLLAGASLPVTIGAGVVAFLAGVTYIVPGAIAILQGGLVERIVKAWGEFLESVYAKEENKEFRSFYHHVMNIVVAVGIGSLVYKYIGLVHLPVLANIVLAVLAGFYTYTDGSKEMLDRSGGNALIGFLVSLVSGYAAYLYLPVFFGLAGGWLVAAIIASVFGVALIAYPFAYLIVRFLTAWAAPALAPLFAGVHDFFSNVFKNVGELVRKVQRAAFDDKTKFNSLFGHLGSVALVYLAVRDVLPLATPYMPSSFWLSAAIVGVVGINLVVLINRLVSRYSAESLAFASGVTALWMAGKVALEVSGGSWVAAGVVGLTAASLVGGIVAPIVYLILRAPANLVLTGWLAPILDTIADTIWNVYTSIWSFVGERLAFVTKIAMVVLGPIVAAVKGIWASVSALYDRLTGGK